MEPSEDEADDDDTDRDTDEESDSSEDSGAWAPKQTSQQPGSSTASTSTRSTAPTAAKPAVQKPAASKFGFKSGFLTGALLPCMFIVVQSACSQVFCLTLGLY